MVTPVDIYGVLDLQQGHVVRAVGGNRSAYQPIVSTLTRSSVPGDVARALVDQLGLQRVYVADLDAIAGQPPALNHLEAIAAAGLRMLVDAGAGDWGRAQLLAEHLAATGRLDGLVVPLESVTDTCHIREILQHLGPHMAVFSLDLRDGHTVTGDGAFRGLAAEAIAQWVWDAGFRRLIVLDVASVGQSRGLLTLDLCHVLSGQYAWWQLISGGGVRGPTDLRALAAAGCHAALVASALHDGQLGRRDLGR